MKKLTPEQRVEIFEVFIDCVKTALATGQGHLVNVRKFDEYLTAHTEPEDCEHGYRINPVEGVHIPCPDCHTEPADEVSKYQIASEVYDEYFASQPYPLAIEYLGDVLSFSQFLDRMKRLQQEKNDNT